jgi:hypothetical protein
MPSDPYPLSEMLACELEAIKGPVWVKDANGQDVWLGERLRSWGDARSRDVTMRKGEEATRLKALYNAAHRLNLAALCLSGGGIRSASVSLGVIQALVDKNLLRKFDFLSTVSGGGYIGSWLSAWLSHTHDADNVIDALREKRSDPDHEPPPINHLRRYSNYLTPKLGIFSADTWTAVAIILRNLFITWLILIPAIALPVVAVKFLATMLISGMSGELNAVYPAAPYVAGACLVFGWCALGYKLYRLYAPPATRDTEISQNRFIEWSLIPAVIGGFCFVWLLLRRQTPADALTFGYHIQIPLLDDQLVAWDKRPLGPMLVFAFVVYLGALAVRVLDKKLSGVADQAAAPTGRYGMHGLDALGWIGGVLAFALLIWAGAQFVGEPATPVTLIKGLCVQTTTDCVTAAHKQPIDLALDRRALVVIFGIPWFLLATMSAHTIYLLLRSASGRGDVEREWLGRASGWHFIAGIAWIALSAVVLLGPDVYYSRHVLGDNAGAWLTALTGASGSVTAFLGKSGLTPAKGSASGPVGIGANVVLAIVGPLFAAMLLILLSLTLDWSILGKDHACFVTDKGAVCGAWDWVFWAVGLMIFLAVLDGFANVNRFSIHALYRNRLVRAYLGGTRAPKREPDGFTDFDWNDNVRMTSLWDANRPLDRSKHWRPFHVVNMTLNLAATKNLAWQQRKASSFTVTPFACGNPDLGYRATYLYGGPVGSVDDQTRNPTHQSGITLGTAMAISGASVSPNMGYHSSPAISFLLTLFNVRLGWWLGNPKNEGRKLWFGETKPPYMRESPLFALRPLLSELFGLTSADSPYVYLSDGGHFEDLGLYEMVRRRCRWIVVCDDDQDGKRGFEDLGNAVRKIWIDLGVRITFPDAPLLQAGIDAKPADIPYFALGTINYVSDDNRNLPPAKLLYIKPVVRGDEDAADVIAYQRANPDFPAQTTADQWFDESQLEAYRRLGYLMTYRMISGAVGEEAVSDLEQLFAGLDNIDPTTMAPRGRAPADDT